MNLEKNEQISDCWSFNRNILYKDTQGVVIKYEVNRTHVSSCAVFDAYVT